MSELAQQKIVDGAAALEGAEIRKMLADLPGWEFDGKAIRREWKLKNFKQAAQLANLVAWQAEAANHHPDITFGWGQVSVLFTTHSAGGVTLNDLVMAARLNRAAD
ncbi:4a-hydroxytetrahydrobiopterin dehydratase [Paracoccus laeviglucosivorans]|uniref:Putative pterin-4-alpha-carbinolamine dehydratase n=1 Tax=Paracoccus laeviglucosivorans TaxID=1197861 RepID=A0A521E7Q2_9RHOB|nr:4a-hydroxytetrahydrobiopterin dehydratase [Paracoccus laeviglucosivorans]SMO79441.1 pterin-4-alpha-carbinolamine dehydratase [Paracoccus laeviglucosivorans]